MNAWTSDTGVLGSRRSPRSLRFRDGGWLVGMFTCDELNSFRVGDSQSSTFRNAMKRVSVDDGVLVAKS